MWIMLCQKTELQISSSLLLCNYHLIRNDVNTWIMLLRSSFERFSKPKPFLFRPMHYLGRVSKPACRFLLGWLRDKRKGKQHKCGEWCGGVRIRNTFISVNVTCDSQFHLLSSERFSSDETISDFSHISVWIEICSGDTTTPLQDMDNFDASFDHYTILDCQRSNGPIKISKSTDSLY